mmetsp:Transcript_19137/g.28047  ORF Transcript_19137/g.28047 Transcript_19137/m.28047 type:complete len:237 (-) Transcript_19137:2185-2895(-)
MTLTEKIIVEVTVANETVHSNADPMHLIRMRGPLIILAAQDITDMIMRDVRQMVIWAMIAELDMVLNVLTNSNVFPFVAIGILENAHQVIEIAAEMLTGKDMEERKLKIVLVEMIKEPITLLLPLMIIDNRKKMPYQLGIANCISLLHKVRKTLLCSPSENVELLRSALGFRRKKQRAPKIRRGTGLLPKKPLRSPLKKHRGWTLGKELYMRMYKLNPLVSYGVAAAIVYLLMKLL